MKKRRAGRRISAAAMRNRTARGGRRMASRKTAHMSDAETRHLAQLVICGSIFVLLVAAKLLLPEGMTEINLWLADALERNMDVQSVFHAVGRAFSGEEGVDTAVEEVYRAVFYPEAEVVRALAPETLDTEQDLALDILQEYRKEVKMEESPEGQEEAANLTNVLYSDRNLPEGVSMEQAVLGFDYCAPVAEAVVSSAFGYREHPTEGDERFHYGVDLAADTGTAVACFADGCVSAVGESSSYGKYCIVDHAGGYRTLYAHCSRVTATSGAAVSGGEKIAEVGETGMATGPHLHFELQREGTYLNPIYYVSAL